MRLNAWKVYVLGFQPKHTITNFKKDLTFGAVNGAQPFFV